MRSALIGVLASFGSFAATTVSAAESEAWLCVADQATGFFFDSSTRAWRNTTFNVQDSKYVIRKSPLEDYSWQVRNFGEPSSQSENIFFAVAVCKESFNSSGFLICRGLSGDFIFNRANGRYQKYFQGGYIAVNPNSSLESLRNDSDADTPFIEIGKCSAI